MPSTNNQPIITVLMTVYNGEKYLKYSIESILSQSFKDFEFLIIDDCSTDSSVQIIRSYDDQRIVLHHNEVNIGQTKSLNVGLNLAKGRYIARIDSDDLSFPPRLEKQLDYIVKHPEYAVVGTSGILIDHLGKKIGTHRVPTNYSEMLVQLFLVSSPMIHVSVLMNKEIICSVGGYNEWFKISQDYELWSTLIRRDYKIGNIPDILVAYRIHGQSIRVGEFKKRLYLECSETFHRNVNTLTNLKITPEKAFKIITIIHEPKNLSKADLQSIQNYFEKIFFNLKDSSQINYMKRNINKIISDLYFKLALINIWNKNFRDACPLFIKSISKSLIKIAPLFNLTMGYLQKIVKNRFKVFEKKYSKYHRC